MHYATHRTMRERLSKLHISTPIHVCTKPRLPREWDPLMQVPGGLASVVGILLERCLGPFQFEATSSARYHVRRGWHHHLPDSRPCGSSTSCSSWGLPLLGSCISVLCCSYLIRLQKAMKLVDVHLVTVGGHFDAIFGDPFHGHLPKHVSHSGLEAHIMCCVRCH